MNTYSPLDVEVRTHLIELAETIGARPTGSPAGRRAEAYVAGVLERRGWTVERQPFSCLDWAPGPARVRADGRDWAAVPSPWGPACDVGGPRIAADRVETLEAADMAGHVVIAHGTLTDEALFPLHFPFLIVEAHRRIARALAANPPLALIAASPDDARPVPWIEDGDLSVPVATVSRADGEALAAGSGPVAVRIEAERRPGRGANVLARRTPEGARTADARMPRVVVTAHLDTKPETPGALDNAAGVAALLALAGVVHEAPPDRVVEIALLNGEDHYAAPGQVRYLRNAALTNVRRVVNCDGVGLRGSPVGVATMGAPAELERAVTTLRASHPRIEALAPWPQGDHMPFVAAGVPALALTSTRIFEEIERRVHTPADTVDGVDPASVAATVCFVAEALRL
ncbi:MAG: M28 family peptidase [Deinococcus-Thermus bacterium]|jgi:aminopeptidase YwaD|nr:M28 family peptidase [Deinococcota bacterium]